MKILAAIISGIFASTAQTTPPKENEASLEQYRDVVEMTEEIPVEFLVEFSEHIALAMEDGMLSEQECIEIENMYQDLSQEGGEES
tara:strand:+ start:25540 stop:25797 length:258 start_codon:yes stop_codon:yes gene_type:complete